LAVRLWLWPDRPLRLYQFFDVSGAPTIYRVDFATCPLRRDHIFYQTDLYLDLFATPDERDYAILDEDELEIAHERGLLSHQLRADILAQAEYLAALLEARRLGAWLASYCDAPFSLAALGERPEWLYQKYAPGQADGWPED
jgi:predicted RNA-binding protein associated with RNAse of E/G family